jgi:hypothetical protein
LDEDFSLGVKPIHAAKGIRKQRSDANLACASSAILPFTGADSCHHIPGDKTDDQGQSQNDNPRHADFPEEQLERDHLGVLYDNYQK